jgi:hypothetical protein
LVRPSAEKSEITFESSALPAAHVFMR